jgi:rhodanese-related sulfurtransferase
MRSALLALLFLIGCTAAFAQTDAPRITLDEAKKAFDAKTAVFVDSRARDVYKQEHIKGALNYPYNEDSDFKDVPRDKTIIVYCS